MLKRNIMIVNKLGLHARAAAKFVNLASQYSADVFLEKTGQSVNGKSIMGVMMLAAAFGTEMTLQTTGSDEQVAMDALVALVEARFDEDE